MNILFVVVNNCLNYGGSERYVNVLSNTLAEKGHDVTIISSGGPIVKYLNKKINHEKIGPVTSTSKQDKSKIVKSIEEVCSRRRIDLIHCNSVMDFKAASLVRKITGIPVIYTAHLTEQSDLPVVGAEFDGKVDKVIAVSNFNKLHLKKTGLLSSKIDLIYHGVDAVKFRKRNLKPNVKTSLGIKEDEKVIMCVARLEPVKGIGQLIEAIPIILEGGNNIKVVFVGDGTHRKEYERLVEDLGVKSKVLFLGKREDVEELLSVADVFCLTSVNEALSFAILEAMAASKPVVATKVGGIPEAVVDQVTGLLVPPGNIQGLAKSINRLLEDKSLARRLGTSANKRIKEHFRFDHMLSQTLSTYEGVLEEQKVFA